LNVFALFVSRKTVLVMHVVWGLIQHILVIAQPRTRIDYIGETGTALDYFARSTSSLE
jgi:hypothetical protein